MFGEVQVGGIDDAQADALSNPHPNPIPIPNPNPDEPQADALFDVIDADGSGVIDADELRFYLLGGGDDAAQLKNDAFDTLFQSLDLNRDGVICRDELREGYCPYPSPYPLP